MHMKSILAGILLLICLLLNGITAQTIKFKIFPKLDPNDRFQNNYKLRLMCATPSKLLLNENGEKWTRCGSDGECQSAYPVMREIDGKKEHQCPLKFYTAYVAIWNMWDRRSDFVYSFDLKIEEGSTTAIKYPTSYKEPPAEFANAVGPNGPSIKFKVIHNFVNPLKKQDGVYWKLQITCGRKLLAGLKEFYGGKFYAICNSECTFPVLKVDDPSNYPFGNVKEYSLEHKCPSKNYTMYLQKYKEYKFLEQRIFPEIDIADGETYVLDYWKGKTSAQIEKMEKKKMEKKKMEEKKEKKMEEEKKENKKNGKE